MAGTHDRSQAIFQDARVWTDLFRRVTITSTRKAFLDMEALSFVGIRETMYLACLRATVMIDDGMNRSFGRLFNTI